MRLRGGAPALLWLIATVSAQSPKNCGDQADCIFQDDCQSFIKAKQALLGNDGCQRESLISSLRSKVCLAAQKKVCCDAIPAKEVTPEPSSKQACGRKSNLGLSLRVVGGEDTTANDNPWNVVLERKEKERSDRIMLHCGGTIIGPAHILTAAHCVWVSSQNATMQRFVLCKQATNKLTP